MKHFNYKNTLHASLFWIYLFHHFFWMKTSTNNYDFSLSKAPWLQLCGGIRSNQLYTFLNWYIQFFDFMVFCRQKHSSWEQKREACVIAFMRYTEMSTGIQPMDIYSFLKCCSINYRKIWSASCVMMQGKEFFSEQVQLRSFLLWCVLSLLYVILHLLKCQQKKQCQSLAHGFYARTASHFSSISSQKLSLDSQAKPSAHVNWHRSVKVSGVEFFNIFMVGCIPNMKRKLLCNDA